MYTHTHKLNTVQQLDMYMQIAKASPEAGLGKSLVNEGDGWPWECAASQKGAHNLEYLSIACKKGVCKEDFGGVSAIW